MEICQNRQPQCKFNAIFNFLLCLQVNLWLIWGDFGTYRLFISDNPISNIKRDSIAPYRTNTSICRMDLLRQLCLFRFYIDLFSRINVFDVYQSGKTTRNIWIHRNENFMTKNINFFGIRIYRLIEHDSFAHSTWNTSSFIFCWLDQEINIKFSALLLILLVYSSGIFRIKPQYIKSCTYFTRIHML